jgi:8-oxo-dGTP pyrophosphatase MutT (NUDIX family)
MIKTTNVCNNCGKQGHSFHNCKLPIVSYGVILFKRAKTDENKTQPQPKYQYLMIRRKNSFGYIDFIRGKYSPYNIYQLQSIIDEMSVTEKAKIVEKSFDELWKDMWGEPTGQQYKNEEHVSSKKFELIKSGVPSLINNPNDLLSVTLEDLVKSSKTAWIDTEWEFPKGRRNHKEKDLDCALREFEEETGIPQASIRVIENVLPFEEVFIGTNHKSYKHKYFLAYMEEFIEGHLDNFQTSEVSKIEWKNLEECLESIRPYNLEKKELIMNIHRVLQEYRFYC